MLRISDARMSGTSYGACVLHVAPESFVGGPLALVAEGDVIELDIPARRLTLQVDEAELARRRAAWRQPPMPYTRGYMLRISDARMSGTSYGACVLHVAPELFVGGPLALVAEGDVIELDIPARKLTLQVSEEELSRRRADWRQPPKP